jgi:hypothetical protein
MNNITIGLYPNGQFKCNIVAPEHLADHIEYNKLNRFGRALFVNGECVYRGFVSDETISDMEVKIPTLKLDISKVSEKYW